MSGAMKAILRLVHSLGIGVRFIRYGLQRIAEQGTVEDVQAVLVARARRAEAAHISRSHHDQDHMPTLRAAVLRIWRAKRK
jgi:hypothetical protein